MSHFLDEVARSLASPMPRRKALKQLGGLLMGTLAASLWREPANAQETAGGCHPACNKNERCCPGKGRPYCITKGRTCCGDGSCAANQDCCGGICCSEGRECCGVAAGAPVCCGRGQTCHKGRCAASRA